MLLSSQAIDTIAQTACVEMKQICMPLEKIGIYLFMYIRIFPDMTGMALSSDPAWHKFFLTNFYQLRYPHSIQFASQIQDKIYITRELFPDLEELADATEFYDFGNGIALRKTLKSYQEFYYFGATLQNIHIINYYLNNLDLLEYFISYFKDKATKVIQLGEQTRWPIPKEYLRFLQLPHQAPHQHESNPSLLADLPMSKHYVTHEGEEIYFTKRQVAIIHWLVQGKTAEEIAIILKLSKRTVEEHIHNMKDKLKCYKLTQLIYKLGQWKWLNF